MDSPEVNVGISRRAAVAPGTIDLEKRTVEIVWSTGARVLRGSFDPFYEELSLDPSHVRMERLTSGATPLLDSHKSGETASVIGVIESARIENGQGIAMVRFAKDEASELIFQKVADGILRNVSVGYVVHRLALLEESIDDLPIYRAVDWEPMEISMVPIGADSQSQVRTHNNSQEDQEMKNSDIKTAIQADRERSAAVQRLADTLNLTDGFAQRSIASDATIDQIRAAAFDEHAERAAKPIDGAGRIEIVGTHQSSERKISLMAEAIAARHGGPVASKDAAQFSRLSVVNAAQHLLECSGIRTSNMSKSKLIATALSHRSAGHSTGDFSALLLSSGDRILQHAYEYASKSGVRMICAESQAKDFRAKSILGLSEAPTLDLVLEGGEISHGSFSEESQSYSLATYARIFSLTRQALINDDLGAWGTMSTKLGQGAAQFIAQNLANLLIANPLLSDGVALFAAGHNNLEAAGTAISVASIAVGMASMRLQTGIDGTTPVNAVPEYLVVPAALEGIGRQILATIAATKVADANPYAGELTLVVDPLLDADSSISWYLASNPQRTPGLEYSHLDGARGPTIEIREGWNTMNTEWRVALDFGSGAVDFRGLYKNPGA